MENHGKVLTYSQFSSALPKRSDFLNPDSELENVIRGGEPFLFLPNDVITEQYRIDGVLQTVLMMIGIVKNGAKTVVIAKGIRPFFDIMVPDDITPLAFSRELNVALGDSEYCEKEEVYNFPFKYYHKYKVPYIRVYYNTLWNLKKGLKAVERITYTVAGQPKTIVPHLAFNETANYWRKISREYGIKLCDWNLITAYTHAPEGEYTKPNCVAHTVIVDARDILPNPYHPMTKDPLKYNAYLKDRCMEMDWDLETIDDISGVPQVKEVWRACGSCTGCRRGKCNSPLEAASVFMGACSFNWIWEKDPFLVVNFTSLPTPPRADCLIVMCDSQEEMLRGKALLVEAMAPDFIVAFNDHYYDWPFVIARAKKLKTGLMTFMKTRMSVIPYIPRGNDKFNPVKGAHKEPKLKIDANTYVKAKFMKVPGFICVDVRTTFRQMSPGDEESSLNYYLAKNKMGSKEDMPYQTMFKIYRIARMLWEFISIRRKSAGKDILPDEDRYALIMNFLNTELERSPEAHKRFIFREIGACVVKASSRSWLGKIDNSRFKIKDLTLADVHELMSQSSQVVHYCNVDALSCHKLLMVMNVVADKREVGNLSFTSMYDGFYRANGTKIRNLAMAMGIKPEWGIAFDCTPGDPSNVGKKYPGAFVVPPKKGLYRDSLLEKIPRRQSFQKAYPGIKVLDPNDPDHRKIIKAIRNGEVFYPADNESIEQNSCNDRPCAGLDFSSLYPSLIMTYNFSPEKCVATWEEVQKLEGTLKENGKPYRFIPVEFLYGLKEQEPEEKEKVVGWFVQYDMVQEGGKTRYDGMGLYASILIDLYDRRNEVKKGMEYYGGPREILNAFLSKHSSCCTESIEVQHETLRAYLARELESRTQAHANDPSRYYSGQLRALQGVLSFFDKELFSPDASRTCMCTDIEGIFREIDFFWKYYNSKQLGIKVFMNTMYGETGNAISPFFIKQVAGAITTYGQKNLKMIKSFVERRGWEVKYGDTDSLYVSPPEESFKELDDQYFSGSISKEAYWTAMIKITMVCLDQISGEVCEELYQDNGTRFLKMLYEEVLFPYALEGKKKYIGVQHMNVVDLSPCKPMDLALFMKSKGIFIRGLEMKKRGISALCRSLCYELFQAAFSITGYHTIREIVNHLLAQITARQHNREAFYKSAVYRLPGISKKTGKKTAGNIKVITFVNRMNLWSKSNPDSDIRPPEVQERFKYVMVQRQPFTYGITGNKKACSKGEWMEYVDAENDPAYAAMYGPFPINIDYYAQGEIIGQFARFITYCPEFDKMYTIETDNLSIEEVDEIYKENDKKAHKSAKQSLLRYYKEHYATKWEVSKASRLSYQRNAEELDLKMDGDDSVSMRKMMRLNLAKFNIIDGHFSDHYNVLSKAYNTLVSKAKAEGTKKADPNQVSNLVKELQEFSSGFTINRVHAMYLGPQKIIACRLRWLSAQEDKSKKRLHFYLGPFLDSCAKELAYINTLKRYDDVPEIKEMLIAEYETDTTAQPVWKHYQRLVGIARTIQEAESFSQNLNNIRTGPNIGYAPMVDKVARFNDLQAYMDKIIPLHN